MSWEELFPVIQDQAYYAVLRYDPRRKDKVQELVCQSYEKYIHDVSAGKEINKQSYKCFVTQRAKEVDKRSVCKKGLGGTSTTDALSFYRRRPDSGTEIISFDEWMTSKPRGKQMVEETFSFNIDFENWQKKLSRTERRILRLLIDGFSATKIAEKIKLDYITVRDSINRMKDAFIRYFHIANYKTLTA
jgi:Bacterial regulatory proteins, luxR family